MRPVGLLKYGFVLTLALFVLWGCPKKAQVTSAPEAPKETAPSSAQQEEAHNAADAKKTEEEAAAVEAARRRAEEEKTREAAARQSAGLNPVYFDFDKAFIREDEKAVMKTNSEWLRAHPGVKVRIEGNCDELGTKEYNQALGERRAATARKYLTDLGIAEGRITLLSYGKEKPVCTESTDECRQKNRRDEFVAMGE